jgi:hypothetical protein
MHWIFFSVIIVIAWGAAFAALQPLNISPWLIILIDGLSLCIVYTIVFLIAERHDLTLIWRSLTLAQFGWILAYVVGISLGNCLFFFVVRQPGTKVAILTAITSAYPVVTLSLSFSEYNKINLKFALPGFVFAITGVVLLAFA